MIFYRADHRDFSYMGRIDFGDPAAPILIYAGSNIRCRFRGTALKLRLENIPMGEYSAVGAVVDGLQSKVELKNEGGAATYTVAEGLSDEIHTLTIFKRMGAAHYFRFLGVETDGELLPSEERYALKLEYYGDSVSAGEVTEAFQYDGHTDPENHKGVYDNSYFSYTYILARRLNAEFYNNSQGGLSLFDGTGYFNGPDHLTGLETTYNKLSYVSYSPMGLTDWDFGRYTPDVVLFAIGQNDASPDPKAIYDPAYAKKWKEKYKAILRELKERYGDPKFILMTTVLMHEPIWDEVIGQICAELDDRNVYHFLFRRNGAATPGHPRLTEQTEMATELEAFIRKEILGKK
ncbi:MAG: GDSL-type esterase/lipase family protein [Bacteroides sp.]|nr:GDSL-type esterase/lipase family protein [Eubacterium sp.]MCM1418361.1 GDSL-type esterase/lipase family protein [Roseburia sp.]MCM1462461.1 GDSL-type esterase/lipase family protein [Bacteroides sp.]